MPECGCFDEHGVAKKTCAFLLKSGGCRYGDNCDFCHTCDHQKLKKLKKSGRHRMIKAQARHVLKQKIQEERHRTGQEEKQDPPPRKIELAGHLLGLAEQHPNQTSATSYIGSSGNQLVYYIDPRLAPPSPQLVFFHTMFFQQREVIPVLGAPSSPSLPRGKGVRI